MPASLFSGAHAVMFPKDGRNREKRETVANEVFYGPNKKRAFNREFKIEAVKLMTEQSYSVKRDWRLETLRH